MSKSGIEGFVARASVFQSPSDLALLFNEYCASITRHDLFNRPEKQVLVEAWTAAMLGLGLRELGETVQVRVCKPEDFPDFHVRYGEHDLAFETTVAMLDASDGKPGILYWGDMSLGPISTGKYAASPPFDHGPLKAAVSRKAHKHYAPPVHLCVYVTYGGQSIVSDEVVRSVSEAGGDEFESVWIVTHECMMCAKRWDPIGDVGRWVPIPAKPLREEQ